MVARTTLKKAAHSTRQGPLCYTASMQERIFSKDDMDVAAREVLARLEALRGEGAMVLALSGDLGAGKTTLAQAIARALGLTETVTSPTFVIEKSYPLEGSSWERLIHIDAYRIEKEDELAAIGFSEACADPRHLIILEWPERVPGLVPQDAMRVSLIHKSESDRILRYA